MSVSGIFIKQEEMTEGEETVDPTVTVTTPVSICTAPVPPTQRVMPSTGMSVKRGLGLLFSHDNMIDTDKVKKFLVTLITFSEGISASAGANVKRLVDSLLLPGVDLGEGLANVEVVDWPQVDGSPGVLNDNLVLHTSLLTSSTGGSSCFKTITGVRGLSHGLRDYIRV